MRPPITNKQVQDHPFHQSVVGSLCKAHMQEIERLTAEITNVKEVEFPRKCQAVAEGWQEKVRWLVAERDAITQQAQMWKQEARMYKSIVQECYQACTGSTGEPGDWNGALPVKAVVAERDALQAKLTALEGQEPAAWVHVSNVLDPFTKTLPTKLSFEKDDTWAFAKPLYSAAGAAPVPEGWQLVPAEPTREQLIAAHDGPLGAEGEITQENESWLIDMYKAMLAAAPKP